MVVIPLLAERLKKPYLDAAGGGNACELGALAVDDDDPVVASAEP
jgi:hypothetical protein